jgi:hypothetical protein
MSRPSGFIARWNRRWHARSGRTRQRVKAIHSSAEATLRTLEHQLTMLRHQCAEPHSVEECAILQNLAEAADAHDCACHEPAR